MAAPSPVRGREDLINEGRDSDVDSDPESEEPEILTPILVEPAGKVPLKIQVGEVTVLFPYKPYESQEQMVKHLVKAAEDGENCLLESPTGTGKTAALLCALLAWQEKHVKENYDTRENEDTQEVTGEVSPRKRARLEGTAESQSEASPSSGSLLEVPPRPRIIYATRTHGQITQVVKQMKETEYSRKKTTICASRAQCCINTRATKPVRLGKDELQSVDEMCMKLRGLNVVTGEEGEAPPLALCEFYYPDKGEVEGFIDGFQEERGGEVFDIEDLMEAGRAEVHCPYYALKAMQKRDETDLILSTYNHIIDLWVSRSVSMGSLVKNSVIVFDEAHNIEGVCRDTFSKYISSQKIDTIRIRLDEASMTQDIPGIKVEPLRKLRELIEKLSKWFRDEERDGVGYEAESQNSNIYQKSFTTQLYSKLCSLGLSPDEIPSYWNAYYIMDDRSFQHGYKANAAKFKIHKKAMNYLRTVLGGFRLIHENCKANEADPTNPKDYVIMLEKEKARRYDTNQTVLRTHANNVVAGGFHHLKLKILCVNSAVAFKKAIDGCRSVVAASGTLSPLSSFSSELATKFHRTAKLRHVVPRNRIFPALLSKHLNRGLNLEFTSAQLSPRRGGVGIVDDVGQILLKLCRIIPNGFLVFFPSKTRMVPMVTRWNETGLLEQLMGIKTVFSEKVWKTEEEAEVPVSGRDSRCEF